MKYLSKLLILLFIVGYANSEVNAQRTVIKHNLYGHLNFKDGVKTYGLGLETAVKERFSFGITGNYGTFRMDETSVVTTGTTERLTLKGFDIIPEVRWYIFSNESKIAPLGFFIGPYAKLMFLEEEYTRLVSESYDNLTTERGFLGGVGLSGGYKLGTDPVVLEILGGFGWGVQSGFISSDKIDPQFSRINRRFMLTRLEFSLGFLF